MAIKTSNKTKKRISITASPWVEKAVTSLARRDKVSVTTKVSELLLQALELEEDLILGEIAEGRRLSNPKMIPHDEV